MFTINTFDGDLNRLFGDFLRPTARPAGAAAFTPAVDVREEDGALVLTADVPGVRPDDIQVSLDQRVLTIAGQRKEPTRERPATFHRAERAWGGFERRFALPTDVDGGAIEASYDAGVLTVRLPKRAEARPRTIEVKTR